MSQSQQRKRPTKAPMRGRGGPRRPPMGSGAVNAQQQNYNNQQRSRSNRGRGRGSNRGRGRGRGSYAQRNYPSNYASAGYQNNQVSPQSVQIIQPQPMQPESVQEPQVDVSINNNVESTVASASKKPRSRPPMKKANNAMFAQFNAPQQTASVKPANEPPTSNIKQEEVAQAIPKEEKEEKAEPVHAQQPETKQQEKKPTAAGGGGKSVKRQPPWLEFTGTEKNAPRKCGWAHRVRQVLSADTLRIALLKPRNRDPLEPPDIIQITLDGIKAPHCQRWDSSLDRNKGRNRRRQSKGADKDTKDGDDESGALPVQANQDEPFAYEAREFVRLKLLNKNIFYAVWKSNTAMNNQYGNPIERYWGDIYYQEKNQTKSLSLELVSAGYALLKEAKSGQRVVSDLSEKEKKGLKRKMEEAKNKKLKLHSLKEGDTQSFVRNISWISWDQQKDFGDDHRGKVFEGIVDQVISGSTIRVELELNKAQNEYRNVVVNIAGINCPKVPSRGGGRGRDNRNQNDRDRTDELLSKTYGVKAREWVEERLLGQIVSVAIVCTSSRQIIAQIIHSKGRIAPSLLKKGLGQYQKWSAKLTDKEEQRLLLASSEQARSLGLNIWNEIDPNLVSSACNESMVTVVQVISGDTVVVESDSGKEERYTLSSIRAPRLGTRGGFGPSSDGKKGKYDAQYAMPDAYLSREAKEFVRRMCIGREVRLIFEYERDAQFQGSRSKKKKFASIYVMHNGKESSIALELIKRGLAELVWHSKNESNRSEDYALLEHAFEKARKEKKGLNAYLKYDRQKGVLQPDRDKRQSKAAETAIKDFSGISESSIKTHERIDLYQYLTSTEVPGVIEFIFGANRVKVYIPSKRVCIAVRLADIRCGNYDVDTSSDPERDLAKKYLNSTILQRDITLRITSTGTEQQRGRGRGRGRGRRRQGITQLRNPNLDGHIYYGGKNVSEYLLQHGLASVITRRYQTSSLTKSTIPKNFLELENRAKIAKIGIWAKIHHSEGDDAKNDERLAEYRENSKTGNDIDVIVSHIESGTLFYVNDANSDAMEKMNAAMEQLAATSPQPPKAIKSSKKKTVRFAAKYDGYYARARVNNRDNRDISKEEDGGNWFVMFIDYGNKASISRKQFTQLPQELRTDKIPPLATRCELAGISVYRKNDRAYNDAGYFFSRYVFQSQNQKLRMKVLYHEQATIYNRDTQTLHVELFVGDKSINQMIAREGFVIAIKPRDLHPAFNEQKEHGKEWSIQHQTYIKQYFEAIKANIALAKDEHKNIFYHGDVDSGEDDNFPDSAASLKKTGKSRR